MDASSGWFIATVVSAPIAGVVGFAVQLRTVSKLRLENEKLELEVARLEQEAVEAERVIVKPSSEEVEKYAARVLFARKRIIDGDELEKGSAGASFAITDWLIGGTLLLFTSYLVYDLVRLFGWLYGNVKQFI